MACSSPDSASASAFDMNTSSPASSLPTFERNDSVFSHARSISNQTLSSATIHFDLLGLLFVMEQLEVDMMPISWNAMMRAIGEGATGIVQRSLATRTLDFAHKRSRPGPGRTGADRYKDIMFEIMVLRHPALKRHPNISRLYGVGWDIDPRSRAMWPVLIMPKASHGTLDEFMSSEQGRSLAIKHRIGLCCDIAMALACMHKQNIPHCDLKPRNVIIDSQEGPLSAKLIDFAFSCAGSSEEDLIVPPKSRLWSAPEHQWRDFTITEAKAMDIYSFGLVCCFIVFHELWDDLETILISLEHQVDNSSNYLNLGDHFIEESFRPRIGESFLDLQEWSSKFEAILHAALNLNPAKRNTTAFEMANLLFDPKMNDRETAIELANLPFQRVLQHGVPNILQHLVQLEYNHCFVREAILEALRARSNDMAGCRACSYLSLIQLVGCYEIGFGVERDTAQAESCSEILKTQFSCYEERKMFESMMERAVLARDSTQDRFMAALIAFDVLDFYVLDQALLGNTIDQATLQAETDMMSRVKGLGEHHDSAIYHSLRVGLLYQRAGRYAEALEVFQRAYTLVSELDNEYDALRAGTILDLLIEMAISVGDIATAEQQCQKLLSEVLTVRDKSDVRVSEISEKMAHLKAESGDFEAALVYQNTALRNLRQALGEGHSKTITATLNLVSIHTKIGDLQEAERLVRSVLALSSKLFSPDNEKAYSARYKLASILHAQSKHVEAGEEFQKLYLTYKQQLGPVNEDTLGAGLALSTTWLHIGTNSEENAKMTEEILQKSLEQTGPRSGLSMALRNNLACIKQEQKEYGAATALWNEIVTSVPDEEMTTRPNMINYIANMASCLSEQGQHQEARETTQKALDLSNHFYKPPHQQLATLHMNFGVYAIRMHSYEEAVMSLSEALSQFQKIHGMSSAVIQRCQTRLEKAKQGLASQEHDEAGESKRQEDGEAGRRPLQIVQK